MITRFLVKTKRVKPVEGDLELANLCILCLKLPGLHLPLEDLERANLVLQGYYAFLDYAAAYWSEHLAVCEEAYEYEELSELLDDLSENIEAFLEIHWRKDDGPVPNLSEKDMKLLRCFEHCDFFPSLCQALQATKSQHKTFGTEYTSNEILDIPQVVLSVRRVIEDFPKRHDSRFQDLYGTDLFKCPRMNCCAFFDGFSTAEKRKKHVARHELPYHCTFEGCPRADLRFYTGRERDKHLSEFHDEAQHTGIRFPSKKDIAESCQQGVQESENSLAGRFQCPLCPKSFTRNFNRTAHMASHLNLKRFECARCGVSFSRRQDMSRHEAAQHGEAKYVCRGLFTRHEDSAEIAWGCGRSFKRPDALRAHYQTEVGRLCTKAVVDNQAKKLQQQRQHEERQL